MIELIEEIKDTIKEGVEEERKRMNDKYDENLDIVNKTNNVPEAIKELVNVYGNTIKQREKMTFILKQFLEADFFKNAEVVGGANYVYFKNGEYSVAFSTSRIYTITLSRTERLRKPLEPLTVRDDLLKFNDLWDNYDKTGEGYDVLVEEYSQLRRATSAGLLFKFRVKKEDIKEFAETHKQHIKKVTEHIENWKVELEEYEEELKMFEEMMKGLKVDLIKFKDEKWHMKYENLQDMKNYEI